MDKKQRGGKRPNSGRKTNYVSREVKLPKEDNEAIKVKYGRKFNEIFRDWVKSILTLLF
jgi:hypothetical protein